MNYFTKLLFICIECTDVRDAPFSVELENTKE